MKGWKGKDTDLTSGNGNGGTGHEAAYGRGGDELYNPTDS